MTDNETELEETARLIGGQLASLLPEEGTVLVVGLGNEAITPDALGPQAVKMVLATRHIQGEFARAAGLDDLRPTAVMAPGVLGNTGVESGEMAEGVIAVVKPAAVVAVDALAARQPVPAGLHGPAQRHRHCSRVGGGEQPGGDSTGISLGIPVIAVGVPT